MKIHMKEKRTKAYLKRRIMAVATLFYYYGSGWQFQPQPAHPTQTQPNGQVGFWLEF